MDLIFCSKSPLGKQQHWWPPQALSRLSSEGFFCVHGELFQHRDKRMVVSMLIQELDLQGTAPLSCTLYLRSPICLLNPGLMETTCSSLHATLLSRSPGRLKKQARAKLNNFGWGLVVVSHILNPFRISLEFKRETPLPTLVQSPGLHQLCLVVLRGAALAGTRVHTVLMLLLL